MTVQVDLVGSVEDRHKREPILSDRNEIPECFIRSILIEVDLSLLLLFPDFIKLV